MQSEKLIQKGMAVLANEIGCWFWIW